MTTRAPWLLLALCIVLGASFRLYHLDRQSFWYDEMFTRFWATGQSWSDVRASVPATEVSASALQDVLKLPQGRGTRDVIRAIGRDDPQHGPLYYLLAHGWIGVFGDSVSALRALSVLIGLLTLPCVFWLCRELELSVRVAQVATALASVSPFFVIYSQEARQYGLYGVTVLVSSALLLRATRTWRVRDWTLYAFAVIAGLYTHVLFATVIVAHLVFVVASRKRAVSTNGTRSFWPFAFATTLALVTLLPWLASLFENSARAARHLQWSAGRVSLPYLAGMWSFNYSALFVDADHSLRFVANRDIAFFLDYGFRCAALACIAVAVWFVWRHTASIARSLILPLIFVPFLSLALPDIVLGGIRSGGGHRYLFPSYIGIVLAVSCLLGDEELRGIRWTRARTAALCGIVACAVVSLVVHANARTWWTKPVGYHLPRLAQIINASPNPLVIAPVSVDLLTMSTLLRPTVGVLPVHEAASFAVPGDAEGDPRRQDRQGQRVGRARTAVFVLGANKELLARVRIDARFDLVPADATSQLWELRPRTGAGRARESVTIANAVTARGGIGQ